MRKNKYRTRRIPAFAMAAAMVLTMMPQTSLTALAKGQGEVCGQDGCTETIGALSEGKEATCKDFGEKKYASCGNSSTPHYYDEKGDWIDLTDHENSIDNWAKIDKSTTHGITKQEGKAATCEADGCKDYYQCETCNAYFEDAAGKTLIADLEDWKEDEIGGLIKKGHKLELIPYEAATCLAAGNVAYFTCSNDGDDALYAVALTEDGKTALAGQDVVLTELTTEEYEKNKNYYTVGAEYEDEDAVVLEQGAHTWVDEKHEDAVAEKCTTDGSYEYGYCSDCETYYAVKVDGDKIVVDTDVDKSTQNESAVADTFKIESIGHKNAVHFDAEAATCKETGCKEYWYCPDCGGFSLSDPTNNSTTELTVKALTSDFIIPVDDTSHTCAGDPEVEPQAATCGTDGTNGVWICDVCGKELTKNDMSAFVERKDDNDVIAADGSSHGDSIEKVEDDTTPDCVTTALATYWYCDDCGKYYVDDNGVTGTEIADFATWKATAVNELDATAGGLIAVDSENHKAGCLDKCQGAKAAECGETGVADSWYCSACKKYYSDENGTVLIGDDDAYNTWLETDSTNNSTFTQGGGKLVALEHDWQSVLAVTGNCVTPGTKAHYKCSNCDNLAIDDEEHAGQKVIVEEADLVDDTSVTGEHDVDSFVPYLAPTCEDDGNNAYIHCSVCDSFYALLNEESTEDDGEYSTDAKTAITAFNITAEGHKRVEHAAIEATCSVEGFRKYYTCENCEKVSNNGTTFVTGNKSMFSLGYDAENHKNLEKNVGKVESTCSTFGFEGNTQCLDCGEITVPGNKTNPKEDGHVFTVPVDGKEEKAATCTDTGYTGDFKCEFCDEVEVGEVIEAKGHKTTTIGVVSATCGRDGHKGYKVCSVCDDVEDLGADPATGDHSYDEGVVTTPATVTSEGVKTFTCTVCGDTKTEAIDKLVCDHANAKVYDKKDATCGAKGYTGDTFCPTCGEFTEGEEIAATGKHSYDEGKVTTEPTTDAEGVKTFTCTVCGDTKTEAIDKLVEEACTHKNTTVKDAKDATCGTKGYTGDTVCSDCGTVVAKGEEIAATGKHSYDEGKVTTEPTTDAEGVKTFTCTVCGDTKTEAIDKLTPEVPSDVPTTSNGEWKHDSTGWWYEHADGSYPASAWELIDGNWYLFNASGYMLTGWQKVGSTWYYLKSDGAMATGWVLDGSTWYFLNSDGAMATGWVKDADNWYYLQSSGAMATGWILDGSTWYYLYSSGAMAANTVIDGYRVDASGAWVQ